MPLLRLNQTTLDNGQFRVTIEFEKDGPPKRSAVSDFAFELSDQQQEDIRWYLEDFLSYPLDPAPKIAARIEREMEELGEEIFDKVFGQGDARDHWPEIRNALSDTRIEIATGARDAAAIPWELIRDPKTDTTLALHAKAFVRSHTTSPTTPKLPQADGKIRILLVICRPGGQDDPAPFRSVASRLIKGLGEAALEKFQLDVLRPPTYESLARKLREAKGRDEPYHVVHFDGHGAHGEFDAENPAVLLQAARAGEHGYLVFEHPKLEGNRHLVDGPTLGKLLVETGTPVLVLNACRSAYAEPPATPETGAAADPHAEVRTFGSLAQEVTDAGVAGVVANRYNIYVETAAQFIGELYARLVAGHPLGRAVSLGRKQLADQPLRQIAYDPRPLRDWMVPLVYEAAPISLFPESDETLRITLDETATPQRGTLDQDLPERPDAGFYGRDETLLALDRAFDEQPIVLLHAYAGSGKTVTAAEFARWYSLTGGIEGPVLFTKFEQHKPLPQVLDQLGQVFERSLEQSGVHWLALEHHERRDVALQVMRQVPLLWIWDNVEPIAGFPSETASAWSEAEQQELADFLRAARGTRARFLLTSRRDEHGWLGQDLPARITLPPMPLQEMLELTRALAGKQGRQITDVEDWRPLLHFTRGNPMTLTVLVGQALRDGLGDRDQVEAFVARIRQGEAVFHDEASEGRSTSLGASLSYGFENAFTEAERKQLALLHLFQGFVQVPVLQTMGNLDADWCLPEVRGLSREQGITLLDRAAEIGLLIARGGGYYEIHPALPWFFKRLFDEFNGGREVEPTRAFVETIGGLGNYYANQYERGNREVIGALRAEEANLLHARRLARSDGRWGAVSSAMQGLRALFDHTGRRSEWARLVDEIVPDFVDSATEGPLTGREAEWSLVTDYRVGLAREAREWGRAQILQAKRVEWSRERAAPALDTSPAELDSTGKNAMRTLAVSVHELAQIQREQKGPECVDGYRESADLARRIGDRQLESISLYNLGNALKDLTSIRNLDEADHCYRSSLELLSKSDRLGRAKCLGEIGYVAWERFKDARSAGKSGTELLHHLTEAAQQYHTALRLTPPDAVSDLAVSHNQLGNVYADAGNLERALPHWHDSIRYKEIAGDIYGAAQTRSNIALNLGKAGRFPDALQYAQAALRNYEAFGDRAQDQIQKTYQLIALIQSDLNQSER